MKKRITRIHPLSVAKLFFLGDLLFLAAIFLPLGLLFFFLNRMLDHNPMGVFFLPPPMTALPYLPLFIIALIHPFLVALMGAASAGLYNFLAKLLGGIELSVEECPELVPTKKE